MDTIYCFDSSAFIDSWRRYYPIRLFPTLWEKVLCTIIGNKRIFLPIEAQKEILNGKDELVDWVKVNCPNVVDISVPQLDMVQEILSKYPKASDYKKLKPNHADPFVVAVAKIEGYTVVTFESKGGSADDPKIPFLCKMFGVECISMLDFFERENIKFLN